MIKMDFQVLILVVMVGVSMCGPTIVSHGDTGRLRPKLGSKKCTFGPSYWCDDISKSAECRTTRWCIEAVWRHMDLPADTDNVCTICIDMVTQARDQLNSNETQEELKAVLEGSCNLIPIHVIAEECDTLVDDFIPELVEVLASEMNPQVVCQVAGLCNSARVDKLLEDAGSQTAMAAAADVCTTCRQKTETLQRHVAAGGQQQLLDSLLPLCRGLGSYSDACSADMAANIGAIWRWVQRADSTEVCMLGNACPGLFGEEPARLATTGGPAVDCDLCIHIVKHWRNILVTNTTKEEFKEILDGICSKTKAWSPKCTQLVDEYYLIIYDYLLNEMRAHTICKAIGLCGSHAAQLPLGALVPAPSEAADVLRGPSEPVPMMTLQLPELPLSRLTPAEGVPELQDSAAHRLHTVALKKTPVKLHHVSLDKSPPRSYGNDGLSHHNPLDEAASPAQLAQLPLSRLGLADVSGLLSYNTELCDLCEFGLHELQKVLMQGDTEDEITEKVGRLCDLLPKTLTPRCHQFVMTYGDLVITLLAQEIDPTQVCPALRLCPLPVSEVELSDVSPAVEVLSTHERVATPGCAICEYAMNTMLTALKDKKTVREIRDALDRICDVLPHTVAHECEELVNTFTEEIIDMVVSGMTADEICITIGLCMARSGANDIVTNSIHALPLVETAAQRGLVDYPPFVAGQREEATSVEESDDSSEEEPPQLTVRVKRPHEMMSSEVSSEEDDDDDDDEEPNQSALCILCEFVIMQVKVELDDNATDAEIEAALKQVCSHMTPVLQDDCSAFVDNYGVALLDALKSAVSDPDTVCTALRLCRPPAVSQLQRLSPRCQTCLQLVVHATKLLDAGGQVEVSQVCAVIPADLREQCEEQVRVYRVVVLNQLLSRVSPLQICTSIDFCPHPAGTVHLMGGWRCQWGPYYFCQDEAHASACDKVQLCRELWNNAGP